MRVYISGPMTGLPDCNRAAFDAAAKRLAEQGFFAVNPADISRLFGDRASLEASLAALYQDGDSRDPAWKPHKGTIPDIIAEIRKKHPAEEYPAEYGGGEVPNEMRKLADRIEAAWNRREICDRMNREVEISTAQMERIVRDAILSYEELYKEAPNDDVELEIYERCAIAQGWLVAHGFERQEVSFDKEESPNL